MKLLKSILILTLFFACKNTNSPETPKNPAIEVDTLISEEKIEPAELWYYATVDKLRLRAKPTKEADVVEQIEEGGPLLFLNEKTDSKERIKLRNRWFEEPWLKVRSEQGNEGWVFGGAVTDEAPKVDFSKMPYDECDAVHAKQGNYKSWYDCYVKVAKEQTKKDARYIKVTPTGYQVTLLSGETKNLVNEKGTSDEQEYREYAYRYYLDKIGYFVFRIIGYESGNYLMLDDKFGYAIPISGMPRLSPDKRKILISNAGGAGGFEFNGIQLFAITDEGFSQEPLFEEELDHYEPMRPVWVDEKTIEFDFIPFDSEEKRKKLKAKLVERDDGSWDLKTMNWRD